MANTPVSLSKIPEFHRALHGWYQAQGRHDLPWRITTDPYAIYLSEVMLQQTQVETVLKRFYFPFLQRFPTLQSLAEAELEEVLQYWQGLGYYSRAANLHKAARQSAGQLPDTPEALMALPGIGRNTAHAVAAFAYRQPVPVLEANVKRVVSRIFAHEAPTEKQLWADADILLDRENPFDYNQAMMDLGATICTPKRPDCPACPANLICRGQENPERYPAPKKKKAIPLRRQFILLLCDTEGRIFAEPRTERFLHGLYRFVEREREAGEGAKEALAKIPHRGEAHRLGTVAHAYSHFALEGEVLLVQLREKAKGNSWYDIVALEKLPQSRTEKKALALLREYRERKEAA